jgi:hypothetical protein
VLATVQQFARLTPVHTLDSGSKLRDAVLYHVEP